MAQKIQYCRCRINLAGQNCHTVIFDETNPVTWPEVQVLMMLHGEENVMEIMPVGIGETYPTAEKNRLGSIYGSRVVEAAYPGRSFKMEYMMTEETNLPFYVDGKLSAGPRPPQEEPKKPEPPPPPPDSPDTDPDEDEDTEAAAAPAGAATFKPSRHKSPIRNVSV